MELELGLKITRTREDVSSSVDFRFSKDPFGPLVLSRETDSRFIIIIHLKGFKKESIEIEINKEGDRITIRGRKAVEEMVLIRWMAWRKEVELRVFKKVFLIPDIVDLDKIKARFDDDDSTLTITMPKRVKGISGFKIEEEEEEEERVEFGDVSVESREEIKNVEECEEENVERGKSDEHSERFETEIQREEEFGEIIMEDKERESQVLGEEEESEDDNLEKIHQIDEQDKILEYIRKLPDIEEEENKQEVMEKQVSEVKAKSDGFGSRAFEEQEPNELGKTKAEEFEFGKLEADVVKKIHELVEKKEEEDENAKIGEEEFEGPKRRGKQEKIKELVEEQTLEAEKNIADDTRKPVEDTLERCEGKHKNFQEEADNEHKEKKINELDEPARCEKTRELEKTKTNDEEKEKKEIAETETKEQEESYRPKILEKQEISEKKTEFDISRNVEDIQQRERRNEESKIQETVEEEEKKKKTVKMDITNGVSVDANMGQVGENDIAETEEFESEKIDEMVEKKEDEDEGIKLQEQHSNLKKAKEFESEADDGEHIKTKSQVSDGGKGIILSVAETIAEIDKSRKVQEIEEQQVDKRGKQFKKLIGGEISEVNHEKKTIETDKGIRNSATEAQEIEKIDSGKYGKEEDMVQELLEEKAKDCQEDESETKTDDVVRKVQGNKEEELYEPKRDHVRKIKELVEEKIAESQIEAECGGLSNVHSSGEQELHEPKIHKERDKTPLTGAEEPSGQKKEEEEEKIVESETITENEKNSIEKVQEMKEGRPEKPESHEKRYKIQQVVEAGYNDHKEEQGQEKVISKQETEEDSSKKVLQEIEKQENDELKRSMVQETGEKDKTRAMKENEIVERRTKNIDGSLSNDGDPGLSKPYKRQEEDKIQELVEMGTSDYREKLNKQDVDEFEGHGKQSNIPPLVEEEKVEEIAEPKEKLEERKPYEDWTHEEQEKRKHLVKEEATNRRDQHSDGAKVIAKAELKTEEDSSNNVLQEIGKQEYDELQRSMVQDKMQETEEKGKGRAMEGNEIVERRKKNKDGSLRKVQEGTELGELERHCKQRKSQQQSVEDEMGEGNKEKFSEPSGKMEGDDSSGKFQKSYEDWKQEGSEEAEYLAKEETTDPKDEHEEKRYERVSQAKRKVEDDINEKVCKNKKPESDKQEQLDKMEGLLGEGASDGEKEGENLVNDFTTKIQEMEQEESHEKEIHEKLDTVQGFVEDKTEDQEHEKAEVAAAVVAKNDNGSSRKVQTTVNEQELEESGKHKDQTKIPQISDPKVKEEDEEIVSKKDTKEQETHVQELQGKTENCKDDDEGKSKQGKTVETMSPERFKTKQATKVQESNDKKNQEPEDKIEELEKKETSNHEVKLVTEDDDKLTKGQEFLEKESSNISTRRPVEQEEFQELKEVEKRGDGEKAEAETKIEDGNSRKFETSKMLELDESEENEEQKKIRKPMDEKNEDIAEEKIQDNIERRIKDQEIKGQKPFELHKNGDNDKIPEPIVERRKYHREEEKGMEERQTEETKRKADNVSPRKKSHQIEDELEKPSEIQESVEQTIQEDGYKEPSKTKSMEDSREYQEKRSDQEPMVEEEGIEKGEQKEKTERIPQVKPKANDDSSRKNEFEEQESTRLREQKKRVKHQEMVERETNDQSKEEKTEAEYDRSRKVQDNEEEKSEKLGETSNHKEGKERNRAVWREGETKTRDDGCRKVKEIEEQEQEKKQTLVKKDLAGQAKEKKDQETKDTDDSSRNVKEDEKQESDEHKRNEEQDIEECGKGDKDNESIKKEVEAKPEDHESKRHVGLKEQDKTRELVQQKTDEETAKTETKTKDNEPSKMQEMKEQETSEQRRLEEQERVKKLVDELEDSNMKKIQEIEKEESIEQGRDEKLEKVQEPVVMATSEDDEEEELEIEFEDSEEDWEAEVIQEMVSDEENGNIRQIKRIKLGFRLVGGSALFMSLIVIVIGFIRSKKKKRCYKF